MEENVDFGDGADEGTVGVFRCFVELIIVGVRDDEDAC